MSRAVAVLLGCLLLAGCGGREAAPRQPAWNGTDVMFLQMSLEYVRQGDQVLDLIAQRSDPGLKALAAELRAQWVTESATMRRWLLGWEQPLAADPDAGAHAGHGDLHSLRPQDIAELKATRSDFDGTAQSVLLGHLNNCVETSRMETAGGLYPPARALAERMTTTRQGQVQQLLKLQTAGTMGA
ncbi:DUF305 domain-containing protein [Actinoplanes sp. N902-109]|uniref:DUF305 domain-containing protein n=1 Tax=Actinoplanes sp. (strain N902-109) TaxID=649831 RepID=UPI0003294C03|nr:DUF305 domain-containing protein [Actinoplanes sp. N902-109]AGL18482.1 hypothetical protein L083_4972 [Actinoplanes sp. N902-109]